MCGSVAQRRGFGRRGGTALVCVLVGWVDCWRRDRGVRTAVRVEVAEVRVEV